MFAVLEFGDFSIIAVIAAAFSCGAMLVSRKQVDLAFVERRLRILEQKLDALLKHEGVAPPPPPPSGLSPEVERLAGDPKGKIAAIRLYREQNPGVGLAEAKEKIEAFQKTR